MGPLFADLGAAETPVLVTQIRLGEGEWLYIASLLPEPYTGLEAERLPRQQIGFIVLTTALLLLFIGLLVHWQSWPLKRLARAAREMSLGADVAPVAEAGGSEVVEVSRAFNSMRERISRYLTERSQLFSAISHDLRTPITRLRLRVELLEDERLQAKFSQDLDELELLVKGALQCVKDTDIHENIEPVDLNQVLEILAEPYLGDGRITVEGQALAPYPGKPLALRRCIGNLIDNAIKYGERRGCASSTGQRVLCCRWMTRGPGCRSSSWNRCSSRISGWPGSSRGMGWGWALRATSPIAMGAR